MWTQKCTHFFKINELKKVNFTAMSVNVTLSYVWYTNATKNVMMLRLCVIAIPIIAIISCFANLIERKIKLP